MSMIFQIRMISGENEDFLRDYEVSYAMSLLDFDSFICEDLGFDAMDMTSFFLSNERWEQEQEFTLMDMGSDIPGAPIAMENVTLGQILRKNHDRLIYVFDQLSDRVMFLELMGTIKTDPQAEYPRITKSEGIAPAQFIANMEGETNDSIFGDAMEDFFHFEGDDFYDDDF